MQARPVTTRVWTLGGFKVLRAGKPLPFRTKAQHKPLALLKTLIALGADVVPEQSLTDALWPESEGDAAHSAFTTTLHRLRLLIGHEALSLRDTRLSLDPARCWVDAFEFRRQMAAAAKARAIGDAREADAALTRALELYRAPFLEGEFDPPEVLSARQRLHGEFLRHAGQAGTWWVEQRDWDAAARLYQRVVEIDDLAEEFYQGLMRAYGELGRVADALALYERFRAILQAKAGIAPSAGTEALREQLLSAPRPAPAAIPKTAPVPAPVGVMTEPAPASVPAGAAAPSPIRERRLVTVLALAWDFVGAAEANPDPETAERRESPIRNAISAVVETRGGLVNQWLGQSCVALFGVPAMHEDDPVCAVRAAAALCRGPPLEPVKGLSVHVRAGIETGLAVVEAGEGARGRYAVTGGVLDKAARLAATRGAEHVLIGPETNALIQGYFDTDSAASGGETPRAFRVIAETDASNAFEAAARRGLTPFTGRRAELETLGSCLARASTGQGQFVTIAGEAGIGKSRLVYEFKRSLDRGGVTVIEGRCQAHGHNTPYLPLLDGLRRGLSLDEHDSASELHEKAVVNLLELDAGLAAHLPHLLHLLSIPSERFPLPQGLQGEARRRAFEEALTAVVAANARRQPLVLIYEDWHWVDEASEAVLSHLLDLLPGLALVLVVVFRPEYRPRWREQEQHRPIVLSSLLAAETGAILAQRIGLEAAPERLTRHVHERTGGNPFFVEEIAQSLRERATEASAMPDAALAAALERLDLPTTVEAAIRSRVDRLDAGARETLRLAAVIGREFNRRVLEAIHPDPSRLPAALSDLRDQDLIRQTRVLPDPEYLFKHVLTGVAVYEGILQAERRALHERVGQAIEILFAGRIEEHYEALAHHYQHSANAEKAIEYLEKAGDKAAAVFSVKPADNFYRSAAGIIQKEPDQAHSSRRLAAIALKWGNNSYYCSSPEMYDALRRCETQAVENGDALIATQLAYALGRTSYVDGNLEESHLALRRGIALAEELPNAEWRALNLAALGRTTWVTGNFREGIEWIESAIPNISNESHSNDLLYSMGILGLLYSYVGEFGMAFKNTRAALECCRQSKNLSRESVSWIYLACVHWRRGDWGACAEACLSGVSVANQIGVPLPRLVNEFYLGCARFMSGDREAGLATVRASWEEMFKAGTHFAEGHWNSWLAELMALAGDKAGALDHAWRCLDGKFAPLRVGRMIAHRALAIAYALGPDADLTLGEYHLGASLDLAQVTRCEPDCGIGLLQRARLHHLQGARERCIADLGAAEALFKRLAMPGWIAEAQKFRRQLESVSR